MFCWVKRSIFVFNCEVFIVCIHGYEIAHVLIQSIYGIIFICSVTLSQFNGSRLRRWTLKISWRAYLISIKKHLLTAVIIPVRSQFLLQLIHQNLRLLRLIVVPMSLILISIAKGWLFRCLLIFASLGQDLFLVGFGYWLGRIRVLNVLLHRWNGRRIHLQKLW